ncbi:PxKF domain-containing protein [Knoellia sp. CPCC 206435]|uniref:PxKF domain-containing protein n=1 Tax=Knoellia terrae TaxID=3404797 RepID=UPI003B42AC0B
MRTWPHRRSVRTLTTLMVTGTLFVAATGTASADLIANGVDDSVDTTIEQMPLSLSTGPGKTTIYVVGGDDDNDVGCNFDAASETVTVNIVSSDSAVATVSPSSLVLTACGAAGAKEVTVTPVGVGSATFTTTVATGTNTTKGGFSVQNARFTAKVSTVPNTPPTLDIVGVEEGGAYPKGTLARPECVATDVDDFPTYPHTKTWLAPLTEITGPYAVDNIGTRYAHCSYVDDSGVQVLARKGYSIIDGSAPTISRVLSPAADGTGWFREDVSVNWTVTEAQSPSSLQTTGCDDLAVTADTKLTTFTCSATSAGGSHSSILNIRRDATPPVVSGTTTLSGGGTVVNGWYTSPVDVTFAATDETSLFLVDGRASVTSSETVRTNGNGELLVESPPFTDRAGNSSALGAQKRTVKVDAEAPNAPSASLSRPADATGWHTGPVTVTFSPAGDSGSGVASCSTAVTVEVDTTGQTVSGTCTDHAGHVSAAKQVTVKLDQGAPVVTQSVVASAPTGRDGWHTTDVDVDFTATDAVSGLDSVTQRVTSSGEGPAVEVLSPAFTDRAGNTTPAGVLTRTFKVDKSAPATPAFVGGPRESHYFGEVPAAPTCTSSDSGSGLASCVVTGGGSTVGTHSYTATATDNAGLTSTSQLAYEVLGWTAKDFSAPVDMGGVFNTVKGGSTVPAKFEVFAGTRELTDTTLVALTSRKIGCTASAATDDVETLVSGSTALKYDTVAGQFQYNWKLPTGAGTCYELKMTAKDGSAVTANFKLR